jgi:mono/diheme cytochrome c family protein
VCSSDLDDLRGAQLYATECAPCHGPSGHGDGPEAIYFAPRPRDLREGFLALYATDELVARIRNGQPLMIDIDRMALRRRTQMIDDIIVHLRRLPDVHWDEVESGAAIYVERCESCHGPFGRAPSDAPGGKQPPRNLADPAFQKSTSDAKLLDMAQHHREGLPRQPELASKADASALLPFLRLLSPGFELYSLWCGGCHGDDGRGDGVFATGPNRPNVVFDRAYLSAQDQGALRHAVQHMIESEEGGMPHLRKRLSEQQARTVIEYLRATEQSPRAIAPRP